MKIVEMYVDGCCKGNPGPGGWGILMIWGDKRKEIWGGEKDTTNNRMELMAAIQLGEPLNYEISTACICKDCLEAALRLIKESA